MAKGNKRNQSVSDFPPEFFDIWTAAAQRQLALRLEAKGTAVNLKHRLYTFRKRLLQEAPQAAQSFLNVDLTVVQEGVFYILKDYIPAWKQQVQALGVRNAVVGFSPLHQEFITQSGMENNKEDNKEYGMEVKMDSTLLPSLEELLPPPMPPIGSDGSALDKTLSNLGYSSDSSESLDSNKPEKD
jgi:hypothetical protein